ncbi:MAG: DinB family protein, partial [Synergistaceae bacterium]|nr:DinB family protein [Synergistaceae bacterium]
MRYFGYGIGFSEQHKELGKIIRDKDRFEEAKQMFLSFHSSLNLAADRLLKDLAPQEWTIMPTAKDETIAWSVWHITRIEDLTVGILVGGDGQIFDRKQKEKLNVDIVDTGNALSDDEIMNLSKNINIHSLLDYRAAVIKRTQNIVSGLSADDMRRKVSSDGIEKIRADGGVTAQEESAWLLDYWGKKDVAGILLMPPTRHTLLHLNDCERWKEHIREG